MRVCLLDSTTKEVINVVSLERPEDHNPTPGVEVAPQHDGDIGWIWNGSGWTDPNYTEPSLEELIIIKRSYRNRLLKKYIDTVNAVRWESFTQEQKDDMIAYRQALLDVPQQPGFPYNITWPTLPEI